jgi:hypothetical protein
MEPILPRRSRAEKPYRDHGRERRDEDALRNSRERIGYW